jgi:hypothetical protein
MHPLLHVVLSSTEADVQILERFFSFPAFSLLSLLGVWQTGHAKYSKTKTHSASLVELDLGLRLIRPITTSKKEHKSIKSAKHTQYSQQEQSN